MVNTRNRVYKDDASFELPPVKKQRKAGNKCFLLPSQDSLSQKGDGGIVPRLMPVEMLKTQTDIMVASTMSRENTKTYTKTVAASTSKAQPVPDKPIVLQKCFHCGADSSLHDFYDVKVCGDCKTVLYRFETMTKDKVKEYFRLSDAELSHIPHNTGLTRFSHWVYSKYNHDTVVEAVKKKYGSLTAMPRRRRR